jgi:heterodisulfide reductase subunit B2
MSYRYYPGCSLEGTAKEYDISVRSTLAALGVEIAEIPDWTCCGASAAEATDGLLSLALPAVNLALAAKMEEKGDVLAPCSACYLNLKKVEKKVEKDDDLRKTLNTILAEKSLELPRKIRVRHLLDVLAMDVRAERIRGAVKAPCRIGPSPPTTAANVSGPSSSSTIRSGRPPWNPSSRRPGPRSIPGRWGASAAARPT